MDFNYYHVDVFSTENLSGNGLSVIFMKEDFDAEVMQNMTKEFKQFETIFLKRICEKSFRARIFTVEEELDFAGHPILGAAAAIHDQFFHEETISITFELNRKNITVVSEIKDGYYQTSMNQGKPEFITVVSSENRKKELLTALNLGVENLYEPLPMEVISTGLPYLIVPLKSGLENVRISTDHFENMLKEIEAKFVYVFDVDHHEGRTWDNYGKVEDVATGSAAGPMGAYLWKHHIDSVSETIVVNQGRFLKRPSKISVSLCEKTSEITVSGNVKIFVKGQIL